MTIENQIILKAEDGKLITNGDAYGTVVYLAPNDNAENWWEITEEEYEVVLNQILSDVNA